MDLFERETLSRLSAAPIPLRRAGEAQVSAMSPQDRSEPKATDISQTKSSSTQAGVLQETTEEDELKQKLKDLRQESAERGQKIEELRASQEQAWLTHEKQKSAFANARKGLQEAQAKFQAEAGSLNRAQKVVNTLRTTIESEESTMSRCRSDEEDIAKEVDALAIAREQAARRAEILKLKSFEKTTLAKNAVSKMTFYTKLDRMVQGTATEVMCRDVKNEVFDALTGVTKDDLAKMAKEILAASEELAPGVAAQRAAENYSLATSPGLQKREASGTHGGNNTDTQQPRDTGGSQQVDSSDVQQSGSNGQPRESDELSSGGESSLAESILVTSARDLLRHRAKEDGQRAGQRKRRRTRQGS
ncbi:hypothetical protein PV11_02812 [Exophiala sideris]|uniref:Uncharacterized protein n=1 Tax=Exophiala sideris TaxID=1016849 RepID=A0A0D1XGG8_9EURO|nr:hypothetical protein PV11_02812 [Exophiala sideris]